MPGTPLVTATTHPEPELVFALVSGVGTDQDRFQSTFDNLVGQFGYSTNVIRVSETIERIHTERVGAAIDKSSKFRRIDTAMTAGNTLRRLAKRGDVLALHVIAEIRNKRKVGDDNRTEPIAKTVHLLRSLKHFEEVEALRRVYGTGFFLIGLHATQAQRMDYLTALVGMSKEEALHLIERDRSEGDPFGQQMRDTFTMSDVFVDSTDEQAQLERFLDMVFGYPYHTPTLDEHAMYLAYGASLRSGQLARQVGAVIVSSAEEVIATGANDVPRYGGGLYWPGKSDKRDHVTPDYGYDSNDAEIATIIDDIVQRAQKAAPLVDDIYLRQLLHDSRVEDLTEYGRPVHAEMEALLACGRIGTSAKGGTLYTTTFPCHNCAKHIVAAGIERVIYVEPYPKSKAIELHGDSIVLDAPNEKDKVKFLPFVGIAARRYFDLFSMRLGSGLPIRRKGDDGKIVPWSKKEALPRIRMAPYSYLDRELIAMAQIEPVVTEIAEQAAKEKTEKTTEKGKTKTLQE